MTREERFEKLAQHSQRINGNVVRTLAALDQVEAAVIDAMESYKAAAHYFRESCPVDAQRFDRGVVRTDAQLQIIRAIRGQYVEPESLDCHEVSA